MKYFVEGGIHEDLSFTKIRQPEKYGPFDSYEQAYDVWKSKVWLNVDNSLHRLKITIDSIVK